MLGMLKKKKLLYLLGDYMYKKLDYYEIIKVEIVDCFNFDNVVFFNIFLWVLIIFDLVE